MKKVLLFIATIIVAAIAQADLIDRAWSSQQITSDVTANIDGGGVVATSDGDGLGWAVALLYGNTITDVMGGIDLGPTASNTGGEIQYGYLLALNSFALDTFTFTETEGESVYLCLYNNDSIADADYYLISDIYTLPDLDLVNPGDTNVTFDFASSTWRAVPEPATVGLFGIGALVAWFARRAKRFNRADIA